MRKRKKVARTSDQSIIPMVAAGAAGMMDDEQRMR